MDENEDRVEGKSKKKTKKDRLECSGLSGEEKDSLSLSRGVGATGADGKRSDKK